MNRLLIILGICIAILFGSTYLIFRKQVEKAKASIVEKTTSNRKYFINSKNSVFEKFSEKHPNQSNLFNDYFNPDKAQYEKDTLISFFVYSSELPITMYDYSYYDCLVLKCESAIEKMEIDKEIKKKLVKIKRDFGEETDNWFQKIGKDKFLNVTTNENCNSFFKNTNKFKINYTAFKEFREFLNKLEEEKYIYRKKSEKSIERFNSIVRKANKSLTSSGRKLLGKK